MKGRKEAERYDPAPVLYVGVRETVNIAGEISGQPEKKQKLLLDNLTAVSLFYAGN